MNILKYSMSFLAGVYILYNIYAYGVNYSNAIILVVFIGSLIAEWVRNKKKKPPQKHGSS